MSRLADALLKVTGATRINYAIFGNQQAPCTRTSFALRR